AASRLSLNTTAAARTNSTAKITPSIVYCVPTRTDPTPIRRRLGPSATVVGPGVTGLIKALGTAFGTARGAGACAGAGPFFVAIAALFVGSLRNAIDPSCCSVAAGASRAYVKKILVRHQGADVQFLPNPAFIVAEHARDPRPATLLLERLHGLHVLQTHHSADHQAAERMEALGD